MLAADGFQPLDELLLGLIVATAPPGLGEPGLDSAIGWPHAISGPNGLLAAAEGVFSTASLVERLGPGRDVAPGAVNAVARPWAWSASARAVSTEPVVAASRAACCCQISPDSTRQHYQAQR